MNLHSRVRAGSAAVLAGLVLLTAACSNATPGAPVAAAASTTSSARTSTTAVTTEVTTVTVTESSTTSAGSTSTSTESDTTSSSDPVTTDAPSTDGPSGFGDVDAVTAVWAGTTCTQMGLVLASVLAAPGLDGTEPVHPQEAWTTYYSTMAETVITAAGEITALEPPTIVDGQVLHDGIVAYLTELGLVAGETSIEVWEAPDEVAVQAAVQDAQARIAALSEADYGLADFQDAEVSALLKQVPECESFVA